MEGYCDGGKNSSRVLRAKEQEEEEELYNSILKKIKNIILIHQFV